MFFPQMYHEYPLVTNSLQSHPRRQGPSWTAARLHGGFEGKTIYAWGVFNYHALRAIPNRGPNILETTCQFHHWTLQFKASKSSPNGGTMSILQLTSRNSWTGLKPAAVTMAFNDRHYPSMALHPGGAPPRTCPSDVFSGVVAAVAAVTTLSQWSCNKRPLFSCLYRSFILWCAKNHNDPLCFIRITCIH